MMDKQNTDIQIISKGEYKHYQIDNFISVKQYMFLRNNGKKCLTLRYTNSLEHKVNGFKFLLVQIDVNGKVISKKKIKINNIVFHKDSDYTCNKGIVVDEKCVDFKVQMLCVYSDRYRYKLKNDSVAIYYVAHKGWKYEEDAAGNIEFKSKSKTGFKPFSVRIIAVAVVAALIILVLSPIITFFTNRIVTNIKRLRNQAKAKKAAAKAAATSDVEESSILETVTYEE